MTYDNVFWKQFDGNEHFSSFEFILAGVKIGVWINSTDLNNLARPYFEVGSDHEKFCVWNGSTHISITDSRKLLHRLSRVLIKFNPWFLNKAVTLLGLTRGWGYHRFKDQWLLFVANELVVDSCHGCRSLDLPCILIELVRLFQAGTLSKFDLI